MWAIDLAVAENANRRAVDQRPVGTAEVLEMVGERVTTRHARR
jgi:hypothetical protein